MKRLALLLLFSVGAAFGQVATPPASLNNWPIANSVLSLTDPGTTNQLVGWDNTNHRFTWYTAVGGGSMATDVIWAAKGDLAVGTGPDAASVLGVGSNGQVLTADSTVTPTGLKWATPTGGVTPPVTLTLVPATPGTTSDALSLANSTAATTGVRQQFSPDIRWQGSGWGTTGTPNAQTVEWRAYIAPTTDSTAPNNTLVFDARTNGASGTWTSQLSIWDGLPEGWGTWVKANNFSINGTAGRGVLELQTQSVDSLQGVPSNGIHFYSDSAGRLVWKPATGGLFNRRFAGTLTADRIYTWPDAAGNVVLDSATQTLTNKSIVATQIDSGTIATARLATSGTASSSTFLRGDQTWAAPAGAGTVTATGGSLTANAVVLGAGTTDTKVVTGIVTDGSRKISLGVQTSLVGQLEFFNATSGSIVLQPQTGALSSGVITIPTEPSGIMATQGWVATANTTGSARSLSISGQTGLLSVTGLTSTNRIKTVRDAADTILELGGSYTPTGTWTSLTMVTPVLGTPTSGTLTNCTGLPISTGVGGLGTNVATFLGTPSSANLLAAITDETGSGVLMFGTSPNITTGFTIGGSASTARKIVVSDGTRFVPSTETYAVPGTSGNLLTSDGTNWTSAAPVVSASSTTTFTNKRINPRVSTSATGNTTPTPNADTDDVYVATGMTVNMVFGAPTGTPVDGQKLMIRIKGTAARTLGFNAAYRFSTDLPVPSTTITTKTLYMGFAWNAADSVWDNLAQLNNF